MQIAVIADIHGNIWALDAVLQDIRRRAISTIVNLGDCFFGAIAPAETAERLMSTPMITISGNGERVFHAPHPGENSGASYQYTRAQLTAEHLAWIAALPATYTLEDLLFCHGTPDSDLTYLLETVTEHGVFLKPSEDIAALLGETAARVICCGHSHLPRVVSLPDGRLIVNPGSVGLPAYDDDRPFPHVMEAGSSHARYAILTRAEAGWQVDLIALPYEWERAAAQALRNNRADYARWLQTGRG